MSAIHTQLLAPLMTRLREDLERAVRKVGVVNEAAAIQVELVVNGPDIEPAVERTVDGSDAELPFQCPICLKSFSEPLHDYRGSAMCSGCVQLLRRT